MAGSGRRSNTRRQPVTSKAVRVARRLPALAAKLALLPVFAGAGWASGLRTDIEFARPGGVPILMDAFIPEGAGPFPAVIWVHGGGFVAGDKRPHPASLLDPLAAAGIAWFSINYRLAPQHVFPAQTDDVESAVAYIASRPGEFRIDPRRLALMGASAGGHLVSYAGARHNQHRVRAVVSFFGEHDLVDRTHPKGDCMMDGKVVADPGPMCLSAGLAKFLGITAASPEAARVIRKASPVTYVRRDMPAYLLIHGTRDFHVPYDQSVSMCEAMKKAGARCELIGIEGGGHGFGAWDKDPAMSHYRARLSEWLARELR
ncbi:MAG: alpha/beta hydrolase [Acidobacteria bacterium]|nr:alpha/beta hydrolase [Acidobacteriota bacterium]